MALWTVYLSLCLLVALNASVETLPVENKDCGVCEAGWTAYGCRCFKFFNKRETWSGAEHLCLYYKGNLASVHSHDEYMFIKNLVTHTTHESTPTWIGLHKVPDSYYWFWSDGTQMNYQIWSPGEPSRGKDELCVEMNSVNGNWNDANCNLKRPYVCVKLTSM